MAVKQLSVFMENKPGRLHKLSNTMGENHLNFVTLSIADTKEYGIVRFVASDNARAYTVLKDAGFAVEVSELVGIEVEDIPNALAAVIKLLSDEGINIDYLYSFAFSAEGRAKILLKLDDNAKAEKLFAANGIKMLSEQLK